MGNHLVICTDHHKRKLHKNVNGPENKRQRNKRHYPKTPPNINFLVYRTTQASLSDPSSSLSDPASSSFISPTDFESSIWKNQDSIASKKTYIIKNMLKVMRNKNTHHLNCSGSLSFRIWQNINIVHNHVFFISQRTRRFCKKPSKTLQIHKLKRQTKTRQKKKKKTN